MSLEEGQSRVYYRIGDDGEWEQCRTTEWPPYRAARQAMDMIGDVLERTRSMSPDERELELDRVAGMVERI